MNFVLLIFYSLFMFIMIFPYLLKTTFDNSSILIDLYQGETFLKKFIFSLIILSGT